MKRKANLAIGASLHRILAVYLSDNVKARALESNGNYHRVRPASAEVVCSSQDWLLPCQSSADYSPNDDAVLPRREYLAAGGGGCLAGSNCMTNFSLEGPRGSDH